MRQRAGDGKRAGEEKGVGGGGEEGKKAIKEERKK